MGVVSRNYLETVQYFFLTQIGTWCDVARLPRSLFHHLPPRLYTTLNQNQFTNFSKVIFPPPEIAFILKVCCCFSILTVQGDERDFRISSRGKCLRTSHKI